MWNSTTTTGEEKEDVTLWCQAGRGMKRCSMWSGAIGSQADHQKHFLMPGVKGGLFSRNHKKVFNQKWTFSYKKFVPKRFLSPQQLINTFMLGCCDTLFWMAFSCRCQIRILGKWCDLAHRSPLDRGLEKLFKTFQSFSNFAAKSVKFKKDYKCSDKSHVGHFYF